MSTTFEISGDLDLFSKRSVTMFATGIVQIQFQFYARI